VRTVIFVPEPAAWHRDGTPGGLSLLERQVRQLRALDLGAPLLVLPGNDAAPALPPGLETAGVVRVPAGTADTLAALAGAADALPPSFVFLAADRLVDSRVLAALARAGETVLVCGDGGEVEPVGRARAADVRRHGAALAARAGRLPLAGLDPYVAELRGAVRPYVLRPRSATEREAAWGVLLDRVQKRTLDLPGQYLDTPLENLLVRRLAPTRVTPNQVTLATLLVAVAVGFLFLHGWLRAGVVLALLVGVLDGVDGKLARLKLATSRLGELEHVGDFFYENFWYLALAAHLSAATGLATLWHAGLVLVGCDLADNLLYLAARRRTGRLLDELTPFDAAFRRVAGRRNVYVVLLLIGILAGRPSDAFLVATAWAALTACVHAVRVGQVFAAPRRAALTRPQGSEIERALASEKYP
jgi:phosphatidylglycerophosphate synthase